MAADFDEYGELATMNEADLTPGGGACPAFGTTSTGTAYFTVCRRTLSFATAATNPWVFTNTDRVAGIAPTSMRMRIA